MANQHSATVPTSQVGSYFVQQYYQVFQQQRDYVHQFYNDSSSMIRVDGETSYSASDMVKIHQVIMSLDFTGIEIQTINSVKSWGGGILVAVSGSVRSRDFTGARNFVQTFFLAPQEKGYFVLNDMFHFADEKVTHHSAIPVVENQNGDYQTAVPSHLPDATVSDYPEDEGARNYVSSINIEGDEPVQELSYQELHQPEPEPEQLDLELEPEPESEPVLEPEPEPKHKPVSDWLEDETPIEESRAFPPHLMPTPQEPQPSAEEPFAESGKMSYASILRAKGKSPSSFVSQPTLAPSPPPTADWNHVPQPLPQQPVSSVTNSRGYAVDESLSSKEGESKSVYVRNLPPTVTSLEIEQEFKSFGRIKSDGVFLRNRPDTGVCYAFVEFEDLQSVRNAIQSSPIQLAGRNVYIEERRPNSAASRGGRTGGRGGGGRGGRSTGRGRSNGARAT